MDGKAPPWLGPFRLGRGRCQELMSSEATMENVTEEATDVAKGMKEATVITPVDPVPDEQ